MLRVIILGTTAALPTKESLPASCAVKYGGTYLFDAPEAVQQQLMKYGGGGTIEAIFLTHLHADHIQGVTGLVQSMNLAKRTQPLLITGPLGTKDFFTRLFSLPSFACAFPIEFKEAEKTTKVFENRLFSVHAFPVKHGTKAVGYVLETASYRRFDQAKAKARGIKGHLFTELQEKGVASVQGKKIRFTQVSFVQKGKKIVVSGDTLPCAAVQRAAKEADLLIHEATFCSDHEKTAKQKFHSTAKQAAEIAKRAKAKHLVLTHFSNRYEDRSGFLSEAQSIFPSTQLASDGLELTM